MSAAIEFRDVRRVFGAIVAVDRVSFTIEPGEFFSMLGPSGSGKTTCLRLIAGFEQPDAGEVCLDGLDVSDEAIRKAVEEHNKVCRLIRAIGEFRHGFACR